MQREIFDSSLFLFTIPMVTDLSRFMIPAARIFLSGISKSKTLEFLLNEGYTPVTFRQLAGFVDGYMELPEKPVCITLDDGYYSNYEYVLPMVTELKVPVTVFMSCKTVRNESIIPGEDPNRLYKMSGAELAEMEASPYVDLQSHTYGLH